MSDVETFYCLIVGSRSFSDYELFVAKCDLLLRNWGSVVIVSGGARGADALPYSPWTHHPGEADCISG